MIQKRIQLDTLEGLISDLDMQIRNGDQACGRYKQKIESNKNEMDRLEAARALKQAACWSS